MSPLAKEEVEGWRDHSLDTVQLINAYGEELGPGLMLFYLFLAFSGFLLVSLIITIIYITIANKERAMMKFSSNQIFMICQYSFLSFVKRFQDGILKRTPYS